ncbi:uncharacterized protein K02A2.6 [Trichonephila clavipes]|nr:uncharacterized protein K02A2.6 [Trichonephila clavipes]
MSQIEALPVTSKELRQETSKDIELGPLLRALREDSFARFGLPRIAYPGDNGSQFTSYEFQRLRKAKNGVRHKTSAPFKPSINGQAERYVATLKQSLKSYA